MEAGTDLDLAVNDLGPLAWVLDELRKSLETASSALRRFVRDADQARGSDLGSVDGGHLRIARQQLHQAVGALEMVGLAAPAHMLRAMEAAKAWGCDGGCRRASARHFAPHGHASHAGLWPLSTSNVVFLNQVVGVIFYFFKFQKAVSLEPFREICLQN